MMKFISFACAVIFALSPQTVEAQVELPPLIDASTFVSSDEDWDAVITWIEDHIDSEDFSEIAVINLNTVVWIDAATITGTADSKRAWEHYEIFAADPRNPPHFRSLMILHEYRCGSGQSRLLAGTSYEGTDRSGDPVSMDQTRPSPWTYVQPGTLGFSVMQVSCRGERFSDGL